MMWRMMYKVIKFRRVRRRKGGELLMGMGRESGIRMHMVWLRGGTDVSRMMIATEIIVSM
jgi:hypothetical protein